MVGDLVTCNVPIRDEGVVSVVKRRKVCCLHWTPVGVVAMRKELVNRIQGVRLNRIICGENNKLWDFRLTGA